MENFLIKLFEKISKYEIVNNLIPGTALCFILSYIGYPILDYNFGICLIICYFVGIINGRFSSIVIETICKKTKFIKWKDYKLYNKAKEKDSFIVTLQEDANMYRSFISVFLIALIAYFVQIILSEYDFLNNHGLWILMLLLLILFLFSYRKQIKYVEKHIDKVEQEENEKEAKNEQTIQTETK